MPPYNEKPPGQRPGVFPLRQGRWCAVLPPHPGQDAGGWGWILLIAALGILSMFDEKAGSPISISRCAV